MHKLLSITIICLALAGCSTTNYNHAYRTYCPNCNAMCRGYRIKTCPEPVLSNIDEVTVVEHTHEIDNKVYMSIPTSKKPDIIVEVPEYDEDEKKWSKTHRYRLYR